MLWPENVLMSWDRGDRKKEWGIDKESDARQRHTRLAPIETCERPETNESPHSRPVLLWLHMHSFPLSYLRHPTHSWSPLLLSLFFPLFRLSPGVAQRCLTRVHRAIGGHWRNGKRWGNRNWRDPRSWSSRGNQWCSCIKFRVEKPSDARIRLGSRWEERLGHIGIRRVDIHMDETVAGLGGQWNFRG